MLPKVPAPRPSRRFPLRLIAAQRSGNSSVTSQPSLALPHSLCNGRDGSLHGLFGGPSFHSLPRGGAEPGDLFRVAHQGTQNRGQGIDVSARIYKTCFPRQDQIEAASNLIAQDYGQSAEHRLAHHNRTWIIL